MSQNQAFSSASASPRRSPAGSIRLKMRPQRPASCRACGASCRRLAHVGSTGDEGHGDFSTGEEKAREIVCCLVVFFQNFFGEAMALKVVCFLFKEVVT